MSFEEDASTGLEVLALKSMPGSAEIDTARKNTLGAILTTYADLWNEPVPSNTDGKPAPGSFAAELEADLELLAS